MKKFWQLEKLAIFASLALAIGMIATCRSAEAQTFTSLYSFEGFNGNANTHDGAVPLGLLQGTNGLLYGAALSGGAADAGDVYQINTSGEEYEILHSFDTQAGDPDGVNPTALMLGNNGFLYGGTGGSCGPAGDTECGIIFEMSSAGVETTVHDYCQDFDEQDGNCLDGTGPTAAMMQASNGDFYGTTYFGGTYKGGTLFKVTAGGKFTVLHSFCATTTSNGFCTDGSGGFSPLVEAPDGNLYGVSVTGGAPNNFGTIFRITLSSGAFSTVYTFCTQSGCPDGSYPNNGGVHAVYPLVVGTDGNLYGTTEQGGANDAGSLFKFTTSGTLTTVYSFCSTCTTGYSPQQIILGSDGNFYGTTTYGATDYGEIFQYTSAGVLTTLHTFEGTDGYGSGSYLMQDTNGNFYGTTYYGGVSSTNCNCGTVFELATGLSPFVTALPSSSATGKSVKILGTSLKGATSVTFNGTTATFKVNSASEITATVPTGATTGPIVVVTPSATLTSSVAFTIP
jgi:uncharacterized repeat protein (TIGR03803 family)